VGELDSGIPYMVMEYLAGEDLARRIRVRGALPVAEAVSYVLQACEALAEAHVAGIVHRDLKPANLFLARRADGSVTVKLLDFGVSKVSADGVNGAITAGQAILGSPTYMPPEQIRSARDVDARGDLWSLGVMLFELVAGRPPFRADTLPELCVRILEEPTPDFAAIAPHAPPGLGAVLGRCLEKEPTARFASLAELATALEPFGPPEGRVSVERVARILRAAASVDLDGTGSAPPDSAMRRLQDAATVKSIEKRNACAPSISPASAEGGQTAHSVVAATPALKRRREAWRGAVGGGAVIAAVLATAVTLGTGARSHSGAVSVAAPPPPAITTESVITTPKSLDPAPVTVTSAVSLTDAKLPASIAPPRRPASATPAGPPPAQPKTKIKPPTLAPVPTTPASSATLSGTEGFGDRK
jgi:eukaryotic-like serine/threonine-protein kinase